MLKQTIGFIGGGQMARALATGLLAKDLVSADRICVADVDPAAIVGFEQRVPNCQACQSNVQLVERSDIVILAVKPPYVKPVATELSDASPSQFTKKLFVSIAAGVPLSKLYDWLGTKRVVRVMPNTPCLVGCGASGFCLGGDVAESDGQLVRRLLESVGIAYELDEKLLDAVTGLSGSGPAFVYQVIEALSDGGVSVGLPRAVALRLAAQTVLGAAKMILHTGEHPAVLKDQVASPGGTTIAGLTALEEAGVRTGLIHAVQAATERSREMARQD